MKLLILLIPFLSFAEDLKYLDVDIYQIENAPIALPIDFFPEEDPYEGIIRPSIKQFEPEFEELIRIHDLTLDYRKNQLKGDPDFSSLDNLAKKEKVPPKLKEIAKEKPPGEPLDIHIYLKKGTKVKDLKFHYTKTIYRDIHVRAVREYPTAPFFKIMDKNGTPRYEARAEDVIYINETIDLNPRPKKFEIQTKTPKNQSYSEKENFEHTLSLGIENWDSSYFQTLTKNSNPSDADTFKFDYKFYHLWDFPVNLGLLASYENGSWNPDWKWNSFYFGLGLKIPWNIASWITLEGQITWQTSLFFKLKGDQSYNLSNNNFALSVELDFNTAIGTYFLGALYRKLYWSTNDQDIEVSAGNNDSSAMGFLFGVKFKSIFNL